MSKITDWLYSTSLYYKFRYYFIRKKAPLSWIFWGEIMRRESSSQGNYDVSIAAARAPDCTISLSRGAPGENNIEIHVYNSKNEFIETICIPLGYRGMERVMRGFNKASAVSRRTIREENSHV